MAIIVNSSNIQIGLYVLCENSSGLYFSGQFAATGFNELSPMAGAIAGFSSAGYSMAAADISNRVDKTIFSSGGNSACVGQLCNNRGSSSGQSSSTHGYTSGGSNAGPVYVKSDVIDKFPFASGGTATGVGTLAGCARERSAGSSSTVSGYASGGGFPTVSCINKFPFATDSSAPVIGGLVAARQNPAGLSSYVSGYVAAGGPPATNIIEKFPFASNSSSIQIGCLTVARDDTKNGISSSTNGYVGNGFAPSLSPSTSCVVDKFPFATDSNARDVLDFSTFRAVTAGFSSTLDGYSSGGFISPAGDSGVIDKFPFATDSVAVCIGCLSQSRYFPAGQQD
jgi:hypothetical protein